MTDWKFAMVLILPLMLHWRGAWPRVQMTRRLQTWGALFGASLIAAAAPALAVDAPPHGQTIAAYMIADIMAAAVVMHRKPVGCAQRAIGWIFACMLAFHIGFFIPSAGGDVVLYLDALSLAGWIQWACLFAWGGYDIGKVLTARRGIVRPEMAGRTIA